MYAALFPRFTPCLLTRSTIFEIASNKYWIQDSGYRINVSLPAVVAFVYYGGVGSLFQIIKKDRIQHLVSGILDLASVHITCH
jgi:hypothetical protein